MYEEYDRTTRVVYEKEVEDFDPEGFGSKLVATVTNSSGDYGYGPEIDKLVIKRVFYHSGIESILYTKQQVDCSFNYSDVEALLNALAKIELD